jgi:hypothetical protein
MKQEESVGLSFSLLVLFAGLFFSTAIKAQTQPVYLISQAKQIKALMDTISKNMPVEKIYTHLDKSSYFAGDTLWFKAYLVEGPYLLPSEKSGIFYIELVNLQNQVLKRMKFPARYGLGWGNISLDGTDLPNGNYLIRAYTTWMLNFGEEAAYTTNIYIRNDQLPGTAKVLNTPVKNGVAGDSIQTSIGLTVKNPPGETDLELTVTAEGAARNMHGYYLAGQSRGVICYAVPVNLKDGKVVNVVPKALFPTGIARFTLLDRNLQSIKERMIYIDQQDQLKIDINTDHTVYKKRDRIDLHIRVRDKNNEPVQGSFSLTVTDDGQVDHLQAKKRNINHYMLLTSELKSQVKDADNYTIGTASAQLALDSLMRTEGWIGYNWKDLLQKKEPGYTAEPEFMITGRVKSIFAGLGGAKVGLFSQKPMLFMDTVAGADGRFVFKNIPVSDTAAFKLQATNKKGRSLFVSLELDEWAPPVFSTLPAAYLMEAATGFEQKDRKTISLKQQQEKVSGRLLDEVNIEAKKVVRGSHNLNGSGDADQVLTEKDLLKEGKKNLLDLLMERVPGLVAGAYIYPPSRVRKFGLKLKNQLVKIIMDGIDVDQTYEYWQQMGAVDDSSEGMQERYLYIKTNLEHFRAEDVKGIEVMYNASYNTKYNSKFLSQAETTFSGKGGLTGVGGVSGVDYSYIEITTRNGRGPFMKQTPGTYLYKTLGFSLPKKFYSPSYAGKDTTGIDIRSTIHWEPNLVTNEKGEATVSFYSADQPTTYTITIEGSDMNGRMGSLSATAYIKISP